LLEGIDSPKNPTEEPPEDTGENDDNNENEDAE